MVCFENEKIKLLPETLAAFGTFSSRTLFFADVVVTFVIWSCQFCVFYHWFNASLKVKEVKACKVMDHQEEMVHLHHMVEGMVLNLDKMV